MMKKFLTVFVIALMSLTCFLCACGDDGSNTENPPAPPAPEEVVKVLEFQKETETVRVYEEVQLLWDYENLESSRFTFTSSNPQTATVDANGKVTGVAEGTSVITVKADGLSDTVTVTVNPYVETKLFVINTVLQAEIFEGETRNLGIKMGYHYDDNNPTAFKAIDLGSITYTIPSEDADVATVDANGKITAVGEGTAKMQVVAKVGDKVIDEFEVTIVVTEKVQFFLSTSALQIFVSAGSDVNSPKPTEYTLTTEVKVNDVVVENAVIEYSGYDEELITVDAATGKIAVVGGKTGTTTITATYTSAKGTVVTKTIDVSVGKPKLDKVIADSEYIVNTWDTDGKTWKDASNYVVADFSADYMFASINSVVVDGRVLGAGEYSYDGYKLAISKDALKNTTVLDSTHAFTTVHNVKIDAENPDEAYVFDTKVTTIDYAIDCAAALESYVKVLQQVALTEQIGYHAILTANINYDGKTFGSRGSDVNHGYVTGILDGRGFAIANIKTGGNAMFWGFAGFTLKNIALVNVQKNNNNQGALLAWNTNGGTNVIENVYIQGELNGVEEKDRMCGLMNNAATINMKNFIMDVEFSNAGKMYAMDRAGSSWHGENTIAVSSTSIGFADCLKAGDANNFYLKSVLEMGNLTESSKNAFTSVKVGEKNLWKINDAGVIVFKNAEGFLDTLNNNNGLNEIVVDTTDFIKEAIECDECGHKLTNVGGNKYICTNDIKLCKDCGSVAILDGENYICVNKNCTGIQTLCKECGKAVTVDGEKYICKEEGCANKDAEKTADEVDYKKTLTEVNNAFATAGYFCKECGKAVTVDGEKYICKEEGCANKDAEKTIADVKVACVNFNKEVEKEQVYIIPVGSNPIKTNLENVNISLKDTIEGVSIVDGNLVIAETVPAATKIVLNFSANQAYTGKKMEATFNLMVGNSVAIVLDGPAKEIVKNQPTKSSIEIDLGDNELIDPTTLSAKFKGSVLDAENVIVSGKTITVDGSAFATSGEGTLEIYLKTVTVEGETEVTTYYVVKSPVSVVDYEIGTAEEFKAYMQDIIDFKVNENTIAKLTDNIDYGGKKLPATSSTGVGSLQGILDGQGHYVSNYEVYRYSTFAGGVKNAVVKNIAFINIVKNQYNDGGLFSNMENKNVVFENVFIQGKIKSDNSGSRHWGVAQNFGGKETTLNNVIVSVEFNSVSEEKPRNVFGYTGSFATATNAFGISLSAQGYSNGKDGDIYASLRHLTSSLDEATIKTFTDTGVWTYDEVTKSLYFKNTQEILAKDESKPEFEIVKDDFIANGDEFVVLQEKAYNLTGTLPGVEFELKEAVEGISIVNNVLAISKEVALGTKFTIVATAFGNVGNTPDTRELQLMVGEVLQTESYIKNKATTTNTDISKYGATNDNTSITLNKKAIDKADFNIENGILKIKLSALPASLVNVDGEMVIEPLSLQIIVTGEDGVGKVIIAKYEVMDMLIETAEDFKAWVDMVRTGNTKTATNNYWVRLANDIDLANIDFTHTVHNHATNKIGTGVVQGLFEGQGHTISNFIMKTEGAAGLFQKYGVFTLKDVAFVNAKTSALSDKGFGYMFAYGSASPANFIIRNSYIELTSEAVKANGDPLNGGIVQSASKMTIEDSFIVITTSKPANLVISSQVKLVNTILLSSTNKALTTKDVHKDSTNWGSYENTRGITHDVTEGIIDIERFDELGYWVTDKNYPEWIGAQA